MLKNFSVITLGCAKNEVDSEFIIGIMSKAGFSYTDELEKAQIIIINTCAFLVSSINESITCVLNISDLKKTGSLKKLILTGCLIHRYKKDLFSEFPEVDIFLSTEEFSKLPKLIVQDKKGAIYKDFSSFLGDEKLPRIVSQPKCSAYIKVAEGCQHKCAYCTIPLIKGDLKSRSITSIVKEAKNLAKNGVAEINLVAQDLSSYGKDLKDGSSLTSLIDALYNAKIPCWFRLLYLYPTGINDGLLSRLVKYENFCNYIDLPLQHSSENILKAMYRPVGKFSSSNIIEKINKKYPQIAIRTTFILGYPNETQEDVDNLKNFVSKGFFSSVGVFAYSFEEGTDTYKNFPTYKEKKSQTKKNIKEIETLQQKIRIKKLRELKGKMVKVLLESTHEETDAILVGRTEFQAPDVDGRVLITESKLYENQIQFGKFYDVNVKRVIGYDLEGVLISNSLP